MTSGDEERLVVLLEARVSEFEKRMARAERRGSQTYGRLRKDSASATRAMEADAARAAAGVNKSLATASSRIGAVGKAWAAGFVGGIVGGIAAAGVSGIVSEVARVAESVASVGDEAKRAGVSAKVFQEWAYVAKQNRIGVDALVDGLKELNLRADEFAVTGKGSAAEAFARLGYAADEVKAKLEDPSELMLEIIGRMEQLDKAAQIRIADELFGGTAGERFVELLDEGEAGIRSTIAAANDLGIVMSDELIATAAELDGMFKTMSATVGVTLKSAIVSAADSLAEFIESFRGFENQRKSTLEGRVNDIIRERAGLVTDLANVRADDAALTENARKLGFDADSSPIIAGLQAQIDKLSAEEDQIIAELQNRTEIAPPRAPSERAWTPPAYTPPEPSAGGGSGGDSSGARGGGSGGGSRERADEFMREAEALVRRTAALKAGTLAQAEINPLLQDFGHAAEMAAARTDLLLAAQQAGVPITAELRARVDELATAYADAAAASAALDAGQAEAAEAAEEIQRLRAETMGGFVRDLLDGASAADALASALGRVGDRLIDMALDGLFAPKAGGGAGIGASLLGGLGNLFGFARGTADTGGRRGEPRGIVHGREAVIPLPDGGRVPVQLQGGAGGGQDVRVHVTTGVTVDEGGGLRPFVEATAVKVARAAVGQGLATYDSGLPDRIGQIQSDPYRRG